MKPAPKIIPRLRKLKGELNQLEPDEPRTHMLRAIFDHEVSLAVEEMKALAKERGCTSIEITHNRVEFHPYLRSTVVREVMAPFEVSNNKLPIVMPPPFRGTFFL